MKDNKIVLKGGYIPVKIENIHQQNAITNTGCGAHKSKRDYKRKPKHKKQYDY